MKYNSLTHQSYICTPGIVPIVVSLLDLLEAIWSLRSHWFGQFYPPVLYTCTYPEGRPSRGITSWTAWGDLASGLPLDSFTHQSYRHVRTLRVVPVVVSLLELLEAIWRLGSHWTVLPTSPIYIPWGSSQSWYHFLNCLRRSGVWAPIGLDSLTHQSYIHTLWIVPVVISLLELLEAIWRLGSHWTVLPTSPIDMYIPWGSSQSWYRFLNCLRRSGVWAPIGLDRSRNVFSSYKSSSCKTNASCHCHIHMHVTKVIHIWWLHINTIFSE